MKSLFISCLFLLQISSYANSRNELKNNISRLANRIDIEVFETEASNADLLRVKNQMRQLLSTLTNGDGNDYSNCLDFALPIYEQTYGSNSAIRKAKELCRRVSDVEVLSFLYSKLSTVYSSSTGLTKAGEYCDESVYGKKRMIQFIYSKHDSQYGVSSAVRKTIDNVSTLEIGSLDCLKRFFPTYSRSYPTSRAMDKTVETCSSN